MSLKWGRGGGEGEGCCRTGESDGGRRERAVVEPVSLRWGGGEGEGCCRTGESEVGGEGGRERAAVELVRLRGGGGGRGLL